MITNNTVSRQFVLPQWLSFNATLKQGELFAPKNRRAPIGLDIAQMAFAEALANFNEIPSPFFASDLLGTAINLGKHSEAKTLAEYVDGHPIVGFVALREAWKVLGKLKTNNSQQFTLQTQIREKKKWIWRFPMDAIAWMEQARLYTIIGQKRRAEKAVNQALKLAPTDRYIIRAAVRFFIHLSDWDRANKIAATAAKATSDPWIIALWISTGTQLGKIPSQYKSHFTTALNASDLFFSSELLESCATHELLSGSEKKAKKAFKLAWTTPAKTVITHSQWVLQNAMPTLASNASIDFSQSAEAMASLRLMRLELTESAQSAREWALEEPFSTKPFMHGSFVSTLAGRYEEGVAMAEEGLRANPKHHGLLNNLAFAYIGLDNLSKADELLQPIRKDFEREKNISLIATWGLLQMKLKKHLEGREYYKLAIEYAKEKKDQRSLIRAILNLLIAEIDTDGFIDPDLLIAVSTSIEKLTDASIIATAEKLKYRISVNPTLFQNEKEKQAVALFNQTLVDCNNELKKVVMSMAM